MNQDFGTPIPPIEELPPQPAKKSNTVLIIVIIVLVVLCCCCVLFGGVGVWMWNNGDQFFESVLPQVMAAV